MVSELKAFLLRGNVIDLAVAVVIGAAFTAIITAIVEGLINPLIALVIGQPDLSAVDLTIGDDPETATVFAFGRVLGAMINFLLVGLVLFAAVRGTNRLVEARRDETTDVVTPAETPEDILLLREIRDRLGPSGPDRPHDEAGP